MIDRVQFSTGAAVGGDGEATATGYSPHVSGEVLQVVIQYLDSPPAATCDITLSCEGDPLDTAIVSVGNSATNVMLMPTRDMTKTNAAKRTYDGTNAVGACVPVYGRLKAVIAQANAGDSCTVTVWLRV